MPENKAEFYTIKEVADITNASYDTIRKAMYSGRIKYKRFGDKTIRIPASELEVK